MIIINPTNADTDTINKATNPLYPLCLLLVTRRLLVVESVSETLVPLKFVLRALKTSSTDLCSVLQLHINIKAQMLLLVIIPIPKCWVARRHTTKKKFINQPSI